jgi:hypothetical protein
MIRVLILQTHPDLDGMSEAVKRLSIQKLGRRSAQQSPLTPSPISLQDLHHVFSL